MPTINLEMPELQDSVKLLFDLMKFGRISVDDNIVSLKRGSFIKFCLIEEMTAVFSSPINFKNEMFATEINEVEIIKESLMGIKELFVNKYYSLSKVGFKVSNINPVFKLEYLDNYVSLKCINDTLELVYLNYIDLDIKEIKIYRDHAVIVKQGIDFSIKYN